MDIQTKLKITNDKVTILEQLKLDVTRFRWHHLDNNPDRLR